MYGFAFDCTVTTGEQHESLLSYDEMTLELNEDQPIIFVHFKTDIDWCFDNK